MKKNVGEKESAIRCSLWFNSSKENMERQLNETGRNSGVGINVGKHRDAFDTSLKTVHLVLDDGTEGEASVQKDSWGNCTHLIDTSIGAWARRNGLWERKLHSRLVPVWMRRINASMFEVYAGLGEGETYVA